MSSTSISNLNSLLLNWFRANMEVFDKSSKTSIILFIESSISTYEEHLYSVQTDEEIIEILDFISILIYLKRSLKENNA